MSYKKKITLQISQNCCLQYYLIETYFLPILQVEAWEMYNKSFKPSRAPSPFLQELILIPGTCSNE